MASGKEKLGNALAVGVVAINMAHTDPMLANQQEHLSNEKAPIEGPEKPGERVRLDPTEQAKTAQMGPDKNPDPPPPQQTEPVQGGASFGKPEQYSVDVSQEYANVSRETGAYEVSADFGKQPPPAASVPADDKQLSNDKTL